MVEAIEQHQSLVEVRLSPGVPGGDGMVVGAQPGVKLTGCCRSVMLMLRQGGDSTQDKHTQNA
jgi:hypothetical protein